MNIAKQAKTNARQLHKFGGSSLADVKCYLRVADIMAKHSIPGDMMVVSAAGNTTNRLIKWIKLSQVDPLSAYHVQKSLYHYQSDLITGLISSTIAKKLTNSLIHEFKYLTALLKSNITDEIYAEVVSHGEIWSARLMAAVLQQKGIESAWLDSRDFLRVEKSAQPKVNEKISYPLLQQLLEKNIGKRIVVTGFISRSSTTGETVLLGRNGSDYSATQIGALAGVFQVTIWSNVPGIYSADPHKVKDAHLLPLLRLDEASELARLSATVLHTRTLQPVSTSDIHLQLRCSYTPDYGSTQIERVSSSDSTGARIITSHDNISLIEIQVSAAQNFKLIYQKIQSILKRTQLQPLAIGVHDNLQLLQLCYVAEVVEDALKILNEAGLSCKLRLRHGLTLIAIIGAGVTRNLLHCYYFWKKIKNQPVEFTCKSEEGISLVAVLRKRLVESLIQDLHTLLFHTEKSIDLVLLSKRDIGSRWLHLFARDQDLLSMQSR